LAVGWDRGERKKGEERERRRRRKRRRKSQSWTLWNCTISEPSVSWNFQKKIEIEEDEVAGTACTGARTSKSLKQTIERNISKKKREEEKKRGKERKGANENLAWLNFKKHISAEPPAHQKNSLQESADTIYYQLFLVAGYDETNCNTI
jgi:hypothetical protein